MLALQLLSLCHHYYVGVRSLIAVASSDEVADRLPLHRPFEGRICVISYLLRLILVSWLPVTDPMYAAWLHSPEVPRQLGLVRLLVDPFHAASDGAAHSAIRTII